MFLPSAKRIVRPLTLTVSRRRLRPHRDSAEIPWRLETDGQEGMLPDTSEPPEGVL